ncbi:MAG: energy transducer TonB [Mariprofundaceae bacterium]
MALGAHALLFLDTGLRFNITTPLGEMPLHVEMVPQDQASKSRVVEGATINTPNHSAQKKVASHTHRIESHFSQSERKTIIERAPDIREKATSKPLMSAPTTKAATILPTHIRAFLLKELTYPKQARRRGWQGDAEFQLDIFAQHVQQLTMLQSTGYPILDRAAKKGIRSAKDIPLIDGRYRLPVTFRLKSRN